MVTFTTLGYQNSSIISSLQNYSLMKRARQKESIQNFAFQSKKKDTCKPLTNRVTTRTKSFKDIMFEDNFRNVYHATKIGCGIFLHSISRNSKNNSWLVFVNKIP